MELRNPKSNIAANFENAPAKFILPPIGVFWDIENCQVPKGKSAIALVQKIREKSLGRHREAEFMCVCDINKESKTVIRELNLSQVTVVHINATSKNAADDKLKQCMRRFVDVHGTPSTILLISNDVNFAVDLSDFRHRHNIRIILLHTAQAPEPLLACAHENYDFFEITNELPSRSPMKIPCGPCELLVTDLPTNKDVRLVQNKLKRLSDNCGGKVQSISGTSAILRFANADAARRAQKRMDKELVYGRRISVNFIQTGEANDQESSPYKITTTEHLQTFNQNNSGANSRDSSPASHRECDACESGSRSQSPCANQKPFEFPPPPLFEHLTISQLKSAHLPVKELNSTCANNFPSIPKDCPIKCPNSHKCEDICSVNSSSSSYCSDNVDNVQNTYLMSTKWAPSDLSAQPFPKNVGRVSPFIMSETNMKSSWATNASHGETPSVSRINGHSVMDPFVGNSLHSVNGYNPIPQGSNTFGDTHHNADHQMHPVGRANPMVSSTFSIPVELLVTNLDQNFEVNEMKKILLSVFREHVMVIHITMLLQPDNSLKALIKVPSFQDAQYAISQLHRRKIGYKRILISYVANERNPPLHMLRSEVVALLNDIPSKKLPLFKFRELFENRYLRTVSVSELYKMRDIIYIQEDSSGRMVCLNMDYRNTPSSTDSESSQEVQQILEKPYCEHHFQISESQGWAEQDHVYPLPDVCISLKALAPAVHTLLDTHQGSLPLNSFCACYEAEIGTLPVVNDFCPGVTEKNELNSESEGEIANSNHSRGVPLEHLIACIPGVQISKSALCIKKVQWLENKLVDNQISRNVSPALAGQLSLFSREMTDLLKGQARCTIPFNKFIPTYHHHFGRQCRVADYGFTKLIDLLESIPHIVQILGQGHSRLLTLTHRAQVKRFAADLLRILKSRASKQITLLEFPAAFEQCIEKVFDISDYGVCEIGDMLGEVSENVVVVTCSGGETIIGIPKREQTPEEIEKTKQFAAEVVELLKHTPSCAMSFNKFIPAYHHHFGKQCRVSDYGFSKLIELFEAIPDVLEVHGTGEDKVLNITEREHLKILSDRLVSVVKAQPHHVISLDHLSSAYTQMHGHVLRPPDLGASDMHDLLRRLKSALKVVEGNGGSVVTLVDRGFIHMTSLRIQRLLMEQLEGKMSTEKLQQLYQKRYGHVINLEAFCHDLEDVVKIENNIVRLTTLQMLARDLIILLQEHGSSIPLQNFESTFLKRFGVPCRPAQYGFPNLVTMLSALPDYVVMKGRKNKRHLILNHDTVVSPLLPFYNLNACGVSSNAAVQTTALLCSRHGTSNIPRYTIFNSKDESLLLRNTPVDLLSQPIPSNVPSPELEPESKEHGYRDLIGFESPPAFQDTAAELFANKGTEDLPKTVSLSGVGKSDSVLQVLMMPPDHVSTNNLPESSNHQIPHYAVVHQYNTIATYSNIQHQPVTYYFDPQQQYGPLTSAVPSLPISSPSVILHQSSIIPVHAVSSQCSETVESRCSVLSPLAKPDCHISLSHGVNVSKSETVQEQLVKASVSNSTMNASNKNNFATEIDCHDRVNITNSPLISRIEVGPTNTSSSLTSSRSRSRKRIAAQFSIPLEPQL